MITAQEASKLYEDSGAKVTDFMKYTVEPMIRAAAESGKDHVFLYAGTAKWWKIVPAPLFYQQLIDKLIELGFFAKWTADGQPYVPRGLSDDDGNGPLHTNFGIMIRW